MKRDNKINTLYYYSLLRHKAAHDKS